MLLPGTGLSSFAADMLPPPRDGYFCGTHDDSILMTSFADYIGMWRNVVPRRTTVISFVLCFTV
jgi:hypothetical protein